ncbi:DUF1653 domain-containing protein [Bacteriovorax sp. DB6_IX]|uniref:DUF1653 domain-containing protein n=1 Tax=Bacteriovorax sp. DB6_IX TaxID=1353530 RepID=UPI0018DEF951|nr:DUF1653 domain-containing protein [Bacteriovorax sp. DB6_IX]
MTVIRNGIYRHYKGHNYKVIDIVKHTETNEELVLYECLYDNPDGKFWVRPIKLFQEELVIGSQLVPRFEYVGNTKGKSRL